MDQGRVLEAERLTRAMETTRANIVGTVGELREKVQRSFDWREQVKAHPVGALAVAATAAVLVGRWLGATVSPGTPRSGGSPRGCDTTLWRGAWTRAGSRVSELLNRVVDELGDTVEKAAVPPLVARVQGFLQPTPKAGEALAGPAGAQSHSPHAKPPR